MNKDAKIKNAGKKHISILLKKTSFLMFIILINIEIFMAIIQTDIIKIENETKKYQYLLKCAINGKQLNKEKFKKYHKPKISIIISVYNREKFIKSTLTSIQNQNMKEIEIIFIDDFSKDKSVNIIEHEMKADQRISLFKNKKNMGNLYTKSFGVLNTKGKYIISLDSDDILLPDDILSTVFEEANKNNLDIVQFDYLWGTRYLILKTMFIKKKNFTSTKPAEIDKLISKNFVLITAKLIDTYIYRKALEIIGEDIKTKINWFDDYIIMSIIYSLARSFKYINKYGYFAYLHSDSSSKKKTFCYDSLIYIVFMYKHIDLNINFFYEIKKTLHLWFKKKCMNKNIKIKTNRILVKDSFELLYEDPRLNKTHKEILKKIIKIVETIE